MTGLFLDFFFFQSLTNLAQITVFAMSSRSFRIKQGPLNAHECNLRLLPDAVAIRCEHGQVNKRHFGLAC